MAKTSNDACRCIYVAANPQQAQLLVGALEEEGIVAFVSNEVLQTAVGGLPAGFGTAPRVMVAEADAARAREIALELEQKLRPSRSETAPRRAWYQFTIRSLIFLTVCVAIYFAVERASAVFGAPRNANVPLATVFVFVWAALWLAILRKRRTARN